MCPAEKVPAQVAILVHFVELIEKRYAPGAWGRGLFPWLVLNKPRTGFRLKVPVGFRAGAVLVHVIPST